MRTYYVTVWDGDVIERFVYLAESEKADLSMMIGYYMRERKNKEFNTI